MIPRTKVSYRLGELLAALVTSGGGTRHRAAVEHWLGVRFGTANVLLTSSGRGALFIVLSTLPQRKLLVPAYTCKAVVEAARLAGKEIVYGETEPDGFNMAPDALVGKLDADTVLLVTHQFGIPCALQSMVEMARAAGSFVIEDAAASLGSRIDGKRGRSAVRTIRQAPRGRCRRPRPGPRSARRR